MMSKGPHKVLKFVCQAMVEILANFVAWVLNKFRNFPWKFASRKILVLFNTQATKLAKISTIASQTNSKTLWGPFDIITDILT